MMTCPTHEHNIEIAPVHHHHRRRSNMNTRTTSTLPTERHIVPRGRLKMATIVRWPPLWTVVILLMTISTCPICEATREIESRNSSNMNRIGDSQLPVQPLTETNASLGIPLTSIGGGKPHRQMDSSVPHKTDAIPEPPTRTLLSGGTLGNNNKIEGVGNGAAAKEGILDGTEDEDLPQNDQPGGISAGFHQNNNARNRQQFTGSSTRAHQPQDKRRSADAGDFHCPSLKESSACPCYKFDDGLVLECPGTTAFSLRTTLQLITAPIQSLSVYDLDQSVATLTPDVFSGGKLSIRHLQFSQSHLQAVTDNALQIVSNSLESLSIVNGRLTKIPEKAISGMSLLTTLDLEANEIQEVGGAAFQGLHLTKLNLKSNRIASIHEDAFKGIELSLSEVDLSDNKLQTFPLRVLRHVENLRSLRLAQNEMVSLVWDGHTKLSSLQFLDLSNNNFAEVGDVFFEPFSKLKTLSLHSNALHTIHGSAFQCLKDVVSVDLSHNVLVSIDRTVFQSNQRLQTIDLSHNHLHYVDDMFSNLPLLREVFLGENDILELSRDVFTNSTSLSNVYLEHNAVRKVDEHFLYSLRNLQQLHMSNSFMTTAPRNLFRGVRELKSLSLDGNQLEGLDQGLFEAMTKLRELRLNWNRLKEIRKGIFQPLPSLIELHLQNNQISLIETDAFSTLTNLLHLNLQSNLLQRLEVALPMGALAIIRLDWNRLSSLGDSLWRGQKKLQTISISNNQLTILHREIFTNLSSVHELALANNSIERIQENTFREMLQLRVLDLSGNSLTEVKRSHFSPHLLNLEELSIRGNRIQSVEPRSFDKLKKLQKLDLSGNFINTLTKDIFQDDLQINVIQLQSSRVSHIEPGTFRNMNNLYELNLEDNLLRADDVRHLEVPSLRMLQLSHNTQLTNPVDSPEEVALDGVFDKLPSLQILRMSNCNIHELPELIFRRNTNLVRIDLSHNQLNLLPRTLFSGLNVLKELRVTGNQLTEFPHATLANISGLETLVISQNHLISIDFSKLNGLPTVRHLDLSDNLISSMSGFSSLRVTQLEFLDLSGNFLMALPSNFFMHSINLQRIDLSRNRFQHIPSNALGDTSLPRLTWLNLTGNPLVVFYDNQAFQTPVKFSFLKELHIRNTNLSIVTSQDFLAFTSIEKLVMSHNRINRISPSAFKSLKNLLHLDLCMNEMEKIPRERLQGLKGLRHLNLSHNVLKELDEFPGDLKEVRLLDLSYNQLAKVGKNILRNMQSLNELLLVGNRLKMISGEAFRNVRQLQLLDLRKNYFEHIPLKAIKVVEAHLTTLRIEDNPIECSCDTQELWEWLRNHMKLILPNRNNRGPTALLSSTATNGVDVLNLGTTNGVGGGNKGGGLLLATNDMNNQQQEQRLRQQRQGEFLGDDDSIGAPGSVEGSRIYTNHLRCDQPDQLRGRILMEMNPLHFCDVPLILKVAVQDIQPYAVQVTWQTREHSGLHGFHVVYRSMEDGDSTEVRSVTLDRWATSAKLFKLMPGTLYQICVVGIANIWDHSTPIAGDLVQPPSRSYYYQEAMGHTHRASEQSTLEALLSNNVTSKCDEVATLDANMSYMVDEQGMMGTSFIQALLARRLGLVVGCCLGIIVFIVLISVLGWLKVKKQRILEETKRLEPNPPDFVSYQPYSISQEEQNMILQTGFNITPSNIRGHPQNPSSYGENGVYITRNEFTSPLDTDGGSANEGPARQRS